LILSIQKLRKLYAVPHPFFLMPLGVSLGVECKTGYYVTRNLLFEKNI
jgi:hypothetical protein